MYAKAQVAGVNGMILLPDDWSASYYTLNNTNNTDAAFTSNIISASDWNSLEAHDAVFLPAAGYRYGTNAHDVGSYGGYWSASFSGSDGARYVGFRDGGLTPDHWGGRSYGPSVRLVRSAQ